MFSEIAPAVSPTGPVYTRPDPIEQVVPVPVRQVSFVEHDADGEIVRWGNCQEHDLPRQAITGAVIEGVGEAATHRVANGKLVAYTAAQAADKAARPSMGYRWDAKALQWVDPRSDEERTDERGREVRMKRDMLLADCDWTQLADVPEEKQSPWVAYRAALRGIPQQRGFPDNVSWPTPPV